MNADFFIGTRYITSSFEDPSLQAGDLFTSYSGPDHYYEYIVEKKAFRFSARESRVCYYLNLRESTDGIDKKFKAKANKKRIYSCKKTTGTRHYRKSLRKKCRHE
jgi:hypothetical protein